MLIDDTRIIFNNINEGFLYPLWESKGYRVGPKGRFFKREGDNEFRLASSLIRRGRQTCGLTGFFAGVGFIRLWKFIRRCSVFDRTDMYSAAGCGGGIERFIHYNDRRVKWSLIDPTSDSDAIGNELVRQYQTRIFPFLEYYKQLQHAISYWEGEGDLNEKARSAAILLLGDRKRAFADVDAQIVIAQQNLKEDPRLGSTVRLDKWRQFRAYLESADPSKFMYG